MKWKLTRMMFSNLYFFSDTKMDRKDKLFVVNEVIHLCFSGLCDYYRLMQICLYNKHNPELFVCLFQVCEIKNCNKCIFFEAKKKQDLYMWWAPASLLTRRCVLTLIWLLDLSLWFTGSQTFLMDRPPSFLFKTVGFISHIIFANIPHCVNLKVVWLEM